MMEGKVMKRILAMLLIMFVIVPSTVAMAEEPRREDINDLVVLHLYGSYKEMGRQQAELLGSDLREVYEYQLADFNRLLSGAGPAGWIFNHVNLPLYTTFASIGDDSSLHEELAGMASGLGVSKRDVFRALFSLAGGSTVFVATRSATADGKSIIGRNVDWNDGFGRRKPLVAIYHPDGDDLDHIFVGWPLVGVPTVGLNEAGLAISLNYFMTDPMISLFFPSWPHRRALQKATTVEEAIEIITAPRRRALSAFLALADAEGDIALVELTPKECAVFRPDGDWFGHSNHARTEGMKKHDLFRHPNSFHRRWAMEEAVKRHLGKITPEVATEILRDRVGDTPFANAASVANTHVLNPAVVHPASLTLWHSTTMQPHAPFGEFVPFTFDPDADPPTLPASEAFLSGEFDKEIEEINAARRAVELHRDGKYQEASEAWDALLVAGPSTLDTRRLALAVALTRENSGDNEAAYSALETATEEVSAFDVRGIAFISRGILADRLGRREDAVANFEAALEHFASRPEFTAFAPMRGIAKSGLENPQGDNRLPITEYDIGIPQ